MLRYALGIAALAGMVCSADAGVFRRTRTVACTTGQCQSQTTKTVSGDTSTAQGAALLIVQRGFRHWGHPAGLYEGIGMASTPQGAIQSCCFWGRRTPVDIATARLNNGMYVAVVRYAP
jgi:hypothetical protein